MTPLRVDVWSDLDCRWCATTHARLREVVAGEPPGAVAVVHRAIELQPERRPGTRAAHQLVKLAAHLGRGDDALEALFDAAAHGHAVGAPEVAAEIVARATGLQAHVLRAALDEGVGLPELRADRQLAARLGVRAVPFLLAGGRIALRGAHEPDVLRRLLATARARAAVSADAPGSADRPSAPASA